MSENLPTDPSKYNVFMFYTGYVESNALSPVIMSRYDDVEFEPVTTWQEAWEASFASLRSAFMKVLEARNGIGDDGVIPYCCQNAIKTQKRFCDTCGNATHTWADKKLPEDEEARAYLSSELLSELISGTNDSYDYELVQLAENCGWSIPGHLRNDAPSGSVMNAGVITIVHSWAESLLVNYEESKETFRWNKETQFWHRDEVTFLQVK